MPHLWNVKHMHDGKLKWHSKVAFCQWGLVGVDVKSHQVDTNLPHPVIVRGNEEQDAGCAEVRSERRLDDIHIPTGGPFAFFMLDGRMLMAPIREAVGAALRREATAK